MFNQIIFSKILIAITCLVLIYILCPDYHKSKYIEKENTGLVFDGGLRAYRRVTIEVYHRNIGRKDSTIKIYAASNTHNNSKEAKSWKLRHRKKAKLALANYIEENNFPVERSLKERSDRFWGMLLIFFGGLVTVLKL